MTVPSIILDRTITAAAAAFSVSAAAITSGSRTQPVANARFAVYGALRKAGLSLEDVAAACHRKDHTTIISGEQRCIELRADPTYEARYKLVEAAALGKRKTLRDSLEYLASWPRERSRIRAHVANADADSDDIDEAIDAVTAAVKRLTNVLEGV